MLYCFVMVEEVPVLVLGSSTFVVYSSSGVELAFFDAAPVVVDGWDLEIAADVAAGRLDFLLGEEVVSCE